jgi:hypothetical protein
MCLSYYTSVKWKDGWFERLWKEAAGAKAECHPVIFWEELSKSTNILNLDRQCPGRDSNRQHLEHTLPLHEFARCTISSVV